MAVEVYKGMPWLRNLLDVAEPWKDALRSVGYGILKGAAHVLDSCDSAVTGVLNLNMTQIPAIQTFTNAMSPVAWAGFSVALCFASVYLMIYSGKNKELFRNILMSVLLIVAIPYLFSTLNTFKNDGISDMQNQLTAGASLGEQELCSAIVDIDASTKAEKTLSTSVNPYYVDINSYLPDTLLGIWNYKITSVSGDGENENSYTLYGEKLGDGVFGFGEERLYAYHYNFWMPLITMLITIIAMLFTGFKVARAYFDIVFHQVIAAVVFATDVNSGTRTKKLIQSLVASFIMLVLVLVVLKIFLDISSWVNLNVSNAIVKIFALGGSAWGVIDGPDIVVKLLGLDAGTRSATNVLMGINAAAGLAGGAIHLAGGTVKGLASGISGAAGMASAMPGIFEQMGNGAKDYSDSQYKKQGDPDKKDAASSYAEYSHGLNANAQGERGYTGAAMKTSNTFAKAGYLGAELTKKMGFQNDSTPLQQAERETGGKPKESAEAAASTVKASNYTEHSANTTVKTASSSAEPVKQAEKSETASNYSGHSQSAGQSPKPSVTEPVPHADKAAVHGTGQKMPSAEPISDVAKTASKAEPNAVPDADTSYSDKNNGDGLFDGTSPVSVSETAPKPPLFDDSADITSGSVTADVSAASEAQHSQPAGNSYSSGSSRRSSESHNDSSYTSDSAAATALKSFDRVQPWREPGVKHQPPWPVTRPQTDKDDENDKEKV